ncbi:MAG: EscU/YscU/HrcU family type III secretion system export apparatus switch protein [Chloroflexota bacterium]
MANRGFILRNTGYLDPNKAPKATALGYNPEKDEAPRVLASGKGVIAEQIIAVAKANNIPIREDPLLAEALARVDIGETIPPELYALVAEVLAYIYRVQQKKV